VRVLVTGASGFIGGALVDALLHGGHEVVCAARRPPSVPASPAHCTPLPVDLAQVPPAQWWQQHVAKVDAVVNAVGILREQGRQTFRALHTEAPVELFRACAAAGTPVVIQVSALGADHGAQSRYHLSKKAADDELRRLPLRAAVVVQPSLVYGPQGASAALFNMLASLPALALPRRGAMPVQPVHRDDVIAGILALLDHPPAGSRTIAFVGPQAIALRDYLAQLRTALGMGGRLRVMPLPEFIFRWGARVAGMLPGSFLDAETAGMLLRGNTAAPEPFSKVLGRPPHAVARFIQPQEAPALRTQAVLAAWLPLVRWSLALLWLWTGAVSLGLYPIDDSLALLARVGLHGAAARAALYAAALLDLGLGVLTLAAPANRRRVVWAAQLVLIAGYTTLISIFLPEYWLHPYGPISKNLPLLAAVGLLWATEPPAGRTG
jgi:uncharacterized protein YbjT (DUF2867 family)